MAEKKKMSLEEAMARLEEVVAQLENDKLPLDKSLKFYEEGVKLASQCANELEAAKRKIQILQQSKDGEIEVVDVPEGSFSEEG
jgi:exodeoxyribonuclease VII small subunit